MAPKTLFDLELELNSMVTPWLQQASAIHKFCIEVGLPLPPALQPLFSKHRSMASEDDLTRPQQPPVRPSVLKAMVKSGPRVTPSAFEYQLPTMPDYGPRPAEAAGDWKAVPLNSASAANLILYIIKEAGGAAPSSLINAKLPILRPDSGSSTVSMTLLALRTEERIGGSFREWTIKKDVPIAVVGQRMWCALEQLRQQDRAALRREVIIEALKINPRMTIAVLSECLRQCEWLRGVAAGPDMVKGDMRILDRDGLVQKEGAFWKLKA
jgi:hypothetical protein